MGGGVSVTAISPAAEPMIESNQRGPCRQGGVFGHFGPFDRFETGFVEDTLAKRLSAAVQRHGPSYFDLKKWRVDQLMTCRKALRAPPTTADKCTGELLLYRCELGNRGGDAADAGVEVSQWEAVLPEEVLRLPDELARVDASCSDAC